MRLAPNRGKAADGFYPTGPPVYGGRAMSDIAVAAILAATILVASTISVEIGLSVALIELFAGVLVGNAFHIDVPGWLSFVGSFAGILLTFLAGAEVDVPQFRHEWKVSLSIGAVSFLGPFVVVGLLASYRLGCH